MCIQMLERFSKLSTSEKVTIKEIAYSLLILIIYFILVAPFSSAWI